MAVAPSALPDALQDRFPVERELGRGGMGLVFLARDLRHQRQVVIKVIRPELASVVGAERFGREIQLAAQLQHPNIVPVYESGECGGTLYYVMPYVAGESLRERLRREGQLPLDEAVRIAREVADALSYAHGRGVVHRDIKPENILLAGGHALVVDFGIARALGAAGGERLTETGLVVGTPAYMSPEQSSGSGALDGRSDLYALASVVYEMLAGEPPYTGPSAQAIVAKRLAEPVPHLRTVREEIPVAVEQAVTKALAKAPADRFATAREFGAALETGSLPTVAAPLEIRAGRRFPLAVATLSLGFAIGLGVLFAWRLSHDVAEPTVRRLAVLPFDNLGDSADGYFTDGVTEAVRAKLTTMPQFQVIASYSSNQYRHTTKPPREIGRELGVDYLLVGTVRRMKEAGGETRIQVSPELVEVGSAAARWEQPFDAALTDVFQLQADVATQVAQALGVALSGTARARLASRPTQNLAAYDSLLRGDQLLITEGRLEPEAFVKAAAAYRAAVRLDSTFGLAWGRLGWAESAVYNGSKDEDTSAATLAKRAADRALVLAPDLAQTYYTMGMVRRFVSGGDEEGLLALFERARELAPQDVNVLTQLGIQLGEVRGRWDEAVTLFARAARLDPRSPLVARRYAWGLVEAGRWKAADSVGSAGLKFAPDNWVLVAAVVEARLNLGDVAGARVALHDAVPYWGRRLVTIFPSDVWLMDDSLRGLAQQLSPGFFHENRGVALIGVAELHWNEGRYAAARASAAAALPLLRQYLDRRPANTERMQGVMTAYAYLGRCADARQVRKRIGEDTSSIWLAFDWLHIAVSCGDSATAVAVADTLIRRGKLSRARLRVDPFYAPLRGRPDFERLVAGK